MNPFDGQFNWFNAEAELKTRVSHRLWRQRRQQPCQPKAIVVNNFAPKLRVTLSYTQEQMCSTNTYFPPLRLCWNYESQHRDTCCWKRVKWARVSNFERESVLARTHVRLLEFVLVFENPIYNYTDIAIAEHMLISHSLSSLNNGIGAKVSNSRCGAIYVYVIVAVIDAVVVVLAAAVIFFLD